MMCGTFYPSNNPRAVQATELYKELRNRGYEIDLCLTTERRLLSPEEVQNLLKEPPVSEKNFIQTYSFLGGLFSKAVCYFIGQKGFYIYYPWLKKTVDLNKYDVLIAISAPFYDIVLAARIKKHCSRKITMICDNGDPFYDPAKHSLLVKNVQIKAYKMFDYICFPVESARVYYEKYADPKKLVVIPQGRNFDEIEVQESVSNTIPTFAYAGCFFMDIRNPESFLKMLSDIKRDFKFVLFTEKTGDVYEQILKKYKKILGPRLEINGFLPRKECIYKLSGMDFLINFQNMSEVQSPSKLIDYTLSKRPIFSVRQDNVRQEQFEEFLDGKYDHATQIDISAFDIKKVAQQYIDLF